MARRRAEAVRPVEQGPTESGWAHYVGDDPEALQMVGMCPNREVVYGKRCGRRDVRHLWHTPRAERQALHARILGADQREGDPPWMRSTAHDSTSSSSRTLS
ncbi:hypothetical protein BJY22_003617 [Kribbella shirazensis]|uniref:Uncharacterized protein n=1 Tax=Kribbella shirazensis TaxID=1105143 RepID=A0A7X5VAZ4_9ACTN|nr:hypothetical protein [Kribbella shirazensis]